MTLLIQIFTAINTAVPSSASLRRRVALLRGLLQCQSHVCVQKGGRTPILFIHICMCSSSQELPNSPHQSHKGTIGGCMKVCRRQLLTSAHPECVNNVPTARAATIDGWTRRYREKETVHFSGASVSLTSGPYSMSVQYVLLSIISG